MEQEDRKILQYRIASNVGKMVSEIIRKEQALDDDVHIAVLVEHPTCYIDDLGEAHTGKLITVAVDFIEEEEEDY